MWQKSMAPVCQVGKKLEGKYNVAEVNGSCTYVRLKGRKEVGREV